MKANSFIFYFGVLTALAFRFVPPPGLNTSAALGFIQTQLSAADSLRNNPSPTRIPHSIKPDGSLNDRETSWWCSGFFPGQLWYLYDYTHDEKWRVLAEKWNAPLEKEQYNKGTHDLGFMLFCSFGNGYRLTKNPKYRAILLEGAKSLASRFDPTIGCIKSWNKLTQNGQQYAYPVIIDNMMNLELLMWASRESGDPTYRNIAITHANTTLKHHFRADNSSYHVICYRPDGSVEGKVTHQGLADESAWARGQAWGLYGYITMYRDTKDVRYLAISRKIATYFTSHLPADKIALWDFNALPTEERDASASAIAASALLELCQYVNKKESKAYFKTAEEILTSLSSPKYRAALHENHHFVIKHCVGGKPLKSEIDVPLVYADYYYLEGLLRYRKSPFAQ